MSPSLALWTALCAAQEPATTVEPVPELGRVAWGRDLAAAQATSTEDGRPVLVLFQEVPG